MEPLSVLLVEANPTLQRLFTYILHKQRIIGEVHTAENDEEALARVAANRPDLILVDLYMPLSASLNTITTLHTLCPAAYIIVLSTRKEETYRRAAMEAGADAFVEQIGAVQELPAVLLAARRRAKPPPHPDPSPDRGDGDTPPPAS